MLPEICKMCFNLSHSKMEALSKEWRWTRTINISSPQMKFQMESGPTASLLREQLLHFHLPQVPEITKVQGDLLSIQMANTYMWSWDNQTLWPCLPSTMELALIKIH